MNPNQEYLLLYNRSLADHIEQITYHIDKRVDELYKRKFGITKYGHDAAEENSNDSTNSFSQFSFYEFGAPYIRDLKKFSPPVNADVRQIKELTGFENIGSIIASKRWTKATQQKLVDAVLDHYSQVRIIELIRQKNLLSNQLARESAEQGDIDQKIRLIDGQLDQIKTRKDVRIFVPQDLHDPGIDWCAISARLAGTSFDSQDCRLMWSNSMHPNVNSEPWTKEEDDCLIRAIEKFGQNDWDSVANELCSNRLPWQCCSRYQQVLWVDCSNPEPLKEADTDKIIEVIDLCRIGNYVPWNQVMYFLQSHSLLRVRYQWARTSCMRNSNLPWTVAEDMALLQAVERLGEKDWNRIANLIPGRSNKSCRERYTMRIKYQSRIVGKWYAKEDRDLRDAVERFGSDWTKIAEYFNGRNPHQLRSRYELLKTDRIRRGPGRHKRLARLDDGSYVDLNSERRKKPKAEVEVEDRLREIFATYSNMKPPARTLICRSAQDDMIYNHSIVVLCDSLRGRISDQSLLYQVISRALRERVTFDQDLISPSLATINGYKAWSLQQDYLSSIGDKSPYLDEASTLTTASKINLEALTGTEEYGSFFKIITSLFLWPAIMSRVETPEINFDGLKGGGIIEKGTNNLYKVRSLQNGLTVNKPN